MSYESIDSNRPDQAAATAEGGDATYGYRHVPAVS